MNLQFVCGLKFRVFFDGVKIFNRINIAALFIFFKLRAENISNDILKCLSRLYSEVACVCAMIQVSMAG